MSILASMATTTSNQHPSPPPRSYTEYDDSSGRQNFSLKNSSHSNTASWTWSISLCCKNGRLSEAISLFTRMRESGIEPNHVTFVELFAGCARFPSQGVLLGPSLHGYARKIRLDHGDVMVGTAIVDMYSKFGELGLARLCFDNMCLKNKVTWNALINGCMRWCEFDEAIELFDEMPERDAVSWTVLIDGFVKNGMFHEAVLWFQHMQFMGQLPDFVTIISVLSAVANLGTLGLGLWLHRYIISHRLGVSVRISNSLIDMYCRCGYVEFACQVFEKMPKRNIVSWNTIIVGLACNGHSMEALQHFHIMQSQGVKPDSVTFTGALTACSHAGLVHKGQVLFDSMKDYNIVPRIEHFGCLVDLYCRAGRLKEAMMMVNKMPMKPNEVILGSLLSACRACEDINFAENLIDHIHDLDHRISNFNVLLSNIYAANGSWLGAADMRKKLKANGVQKKPGISVIEVNGRIHEFFAGDKSHADSENVYFVLNHLSGELKQYGHSWETDFLDSW